MKTERKDAWKAYTRKSIHDAVVKVLAADGPEKLTMDRVADEAGVAKGTLYSYFKDKEELLSSTIEEILEPFMESQHVLLKSDLPLEMKLKEFVFRNLAYFNDNRDFFHVLQLEQHMSDHKWKRFRSSRHQRMLKELSKIFKQGVEAELFIETDPVRLATILFEANIAIIDQRLTSDNPPPVEDDAGLIMRVFFNGAKRERK